MRPMRALAVVAAVLVPGIAWAHHFMESELPRTAAQGFLSGLAHPVIGLDHAAFIVAAGFLLALCRHGLWGVGALVAGSLAGAALHLNGIDLPGGEAAVALSVIAVGVLVAMRRTLPLGALAAGLALAGALHGHAYAESIFGAEPLPLGAYLAGFSAIQLALAAGALLLHRHLRHGWSRPAASLIGGTAGAVGLFFLLV
jgi:urease accessory protein